MLSPMSMSMRMKDKITKGIIKEGVQGAVELWKELVFSLNLTQRLGVRGRIIGHNILISRAHLV